MRVFKYMFVVFLLAACAQLGLQTADTFDKKLAYAYGTHTAVQNATSNRINQHQLTAADGEAVLKLADDSRILLDAAKATGDPTEAASKLALAMSVLTQLQAYLDTRQGVK